MKRNRYTDLLDYTRQVLKKKDSELRYSPFKLNTPIVTHSINSQITLTVGSCEYKEIDSTAYNSVDGCGYVFFLNGLYLNFEIKD